MLFHLIGKLCEHASLAITTNLGFAEWACVFGDAKLTTATATSSKPTTTATASKPIPPIPMEPKPKPELSSSPKPVAYF